MAEKKMTESTAEVSTATKKAVTYTVEEYAASAEKLFKVSADVVRAAFRTNNVSEATKTEAAKIVSDFSKRAIKAKGEE